MKLTRATIPMCPQCKVALDWEWDDDAKDQGDGRCPKCRAPWFLHGFNHPDWGYHAPDVEGVVDSMKSGLPSDADEHPMARIVTNGEVLDWIDRLEGKS